MDKKGVSASSAREELFELTSELVFLQDPRDGRILEANESAVRALSRSAAGLLGRAVEELCARPAERERARQFLVNIKRWGRDSFRASLDTNTGAALQAELRGVRVDHRGRRAVLTVASDVSELARERRRSRFLFEAFRESNDLVCWCDKKGAIVDANEAFLRRYGYSRAEALGRSPGLLRSGHSTPELYKAMWESLLDPGKGRWRGRMINRAKDGSEIPVDLSIRAVRDGDGELAGFVGNARDLTDQAALERRAADREALAAVGERTAAIGHEIRNPLGSIVTAANQLASRSLKPQERDVVRRILLAESRRLNEALADLLAFARPRELKMERSDLGAVAEEVVSMVTSTPDLVKAVGIQLALDGALKPFPMDPDQIRQVVWNLVINAVQAIDGAGELRVETGRWGNAAFLRVRDSGPGVPEAILQSLFKPFQTTKENGTGLGLAICDRIVKAHGGRIEVDSSSQGASFTVFLPDAEE